MRFGENWRRAQRQDRLHARRKSDGRDDDFISGPDAERRESDMQGRSAGINRDGVLDAEIFPELLLEL